MRRFYLPYNGECQVTFLDGVLDDELMLDVPMFYEHQVRLNGKWENFVCVAETEPCPICEKGESRNSLVGILTVIDHTRTDQERPERRQGDQGHQEAVRRQAADPEEAGEEGRQRPAGSPAAPSRSRAPATRSPRSAPTSSWSSSCRPSS